MDFLRIKTSAKKTINAFRRSILIIVSILLLLALFSNVVSKEFISKIFTGNNILDPIIGASFGSIAAGNPVNSYILGGELINQGVSLIAVTAFILAWVTVGIVQLPAESLMLGKKFAIYRNITAFITAVVVAILTIFTLQLFA